MKSKGGLPPVLAKRPRVNPDEKSGGPAMTQRYFESKLPPPVPTPEPQQEKKGLSQFIRPRSPFTGPGPATAGRKRYRKRKQTRRNRKH